jgi:hypothetical protein
MNQQAGLGFEAPHKGATDVWLTPPEILHALTVPPFGPFDLDPCAADPRPWDTAKKHYTEADDGLSKRWHGRVWLNPPYGPQTGRWLESLAQHGNGIALVYARTETKAFHIAWQRASGFLFLASRLRFRLQDGGVSSHGGAPSVLIAFGQKNARCLFDCALRGAYVEGVVWKG